ncbi:hypothetical protein BGS_0010 [Beggiatoa sp. SS]|nr:hypothetical protein BGS_0010 [Beggiatoa sp. SS]
MMILHDINHSQLNNYQVILEVHKISSFSVISYQLSMH